MPSDQFIYSADDVLSMLDALLTDESPDRWDEFHADRTRAIPFFTDAPDESLAEWTENGLLAPGGITPGRVLELGCGHGRNAAYLAGLGCDVDAVDFSARAIERARERPRPRPALSPTSAARSLTRSSPRAPTTWSTTRAASTISRRTGAATTSSW